MNCVCEIMCLICTLLICIVCTFSIKSSPFSFFCFSPTFT
uniref:Uncharacterized protein n=1 Tax=Schistosoma curassoni TaxID=6186 RepID=A0A183JPY5_9TREM